VALVRTDVSVERTASIIRAKRISELVTKSATSVLTRAVRRHIPEDGKLHSYHRENLKSYIVFLYGEATHRHFRRLAS
jgi:hypothetical protein